MVDGTCNVHGTDDRPEELECRELLGGSLEGRIITKLDHKETEMWIHVAQDKVAW
jgi:hypothetical protein